MIILDTNVLSELNNPTPNPNVMTWLDAQFDDLFLTAVTVGELNFGLARLPPGRRRAALAAGLAHLLTAEFDGRILPYDEAAAVEYGVLVAERVGRGRPVSVLDAQIAAIALIHDATVATRDTGGFEHPGLHVVDPWSAPG
jgi:toxin FitB